MALSIPKQGRVMEASLLSISRSAASATWMSSSLPDMTEEHLSSAAATIAISSCGRGRSSLFLSMFLAELSLLGSYCAKRTAVAATLVCALLRADDVEHPSRSMLFAELLLLGSRYNNTPNDGTAVLNPYVRTS